MTELNEEFDEFEELSSHPIQEPGETKTPLIVLVDDSGSLFPYKNELAAGLKEVIEVIRNDDVAKYGIDLEYILFNNDVRASGFAAAESLDVPAVQCSGSTAMYRALAKACEDYNSRRKQYLADNVNHKRGLIILLTDGVPTDSICAGYKELLEMKKQDRITIIPIGIGSKYDKKILNEIATAGICECNASNIRSAMRFVSSSAVAVSRSKSNETITLKPQNYGLVIKG